MTHLAPPIYVDGPNTAKYPHDRTQRIRRLTFSLDGMGLFSVSYSIVTFNEHVSIAVSDSLKGQW